MVEVAGADGGGNFGVDRVGAPRVTPMFPPKFVDPPPVRKGFDWTNAGGTAEATELCRNGGRLLAGGGGGGSRLGRGSKGREAAKVGRNSPVDSKLRVKFNGINSRKRKKIRTGR